LSSVILTGDTSGTLTVSAPLVAGSNTLTLAAATGTLSPLVSATAVASTSGTSIDFTGIPSWAKRITVMFNGVSTNGTSVMQVQVGSGSVTTSGYVSQTSTIANISVTATGGFTQTYAHLAANVNGGLFVITLVSGFTYLGCGTMNTIASTNNAYINAGTVTLGGILDRVRITTVNGTDTFDAGSINILYE
jgi:hypothetical protein